MQKNYDIIIVGSGIVGATAALALAQQTPLKIALLDAQPINAKCSLTTYGARVSAISPASQRIFQRLKVWSAIRAKRISPYHKMHVWDAAGAGKLDFDSATLAADALGYIIEDDVIRASLIEQFQTVTNLDVIAPVQLLTLIEQSDSIVLTANIDSGNLTLHGKLLIAADGGNSWCRKQAGITIQTRPYHHDAIVATAQTSLPHQQTAYQRFLATGPLAFLPLDDPRTASIVWSTTASEAQRLLALTDLDFCAELAKAFAYQLGDVTTVSPRQSFTLQMRHANQYIKPRLALVGDAAHTIHPLAGQGVNLGLLDVASLVEVITKALAQNRDFASMSILRRYERWRKAENVTMLAFVDGIKYLFVNDNKAIQSMRLAGLNIMDKMQLVKHFFANYAAGNRSSLPLLASCQSALEVRE
jgi:2-octaprenylphenol hydroxylase